MNAPGSPKAIDSRPGRDHDEWVKLSTISIVAWALCSGCERMAPHVDSKTTGAPPAPVFNPEEWQIGEEVACEAPSSGFDRLNEEAKERGLDLSYSPSLDPKNCPGVDGGVVATDIDDDGDIDLLLHNSEGFPHLFINNGDGRFSPLDPDVAVDLPAGRRVTAAAAHDLNGDRLPDVLITGDGFLAMSMNRGDASFGRLQILHLEEGYPYTCFNTVAAGDIDSDNDLDLLLPSLDLITHEGHYAEADEAEVGTPDLLFIQDASGFGSPIELQAWPDPNLSMFAIFTDRDLDGDMDLLVGTDRPNSLIPPMAFWRNDGLDEDGHPTLINDAAEIYADLNISAMGVGSADLNGDGLFDYCLTDLHSSIQCLMSDGAGSYYEGGTALGLSPNLKSHPDWKEDQHTPGQWTTWSAELEDLDNDGLRDLAVTAGPPTDGNLIFDAGFTSVQPDTLFQGHLDGFTDEGQATGFWSGAAHYGMAAADLDRDGALDLVVGTWEGAVELWSNPCTEGAWLTIEPLGPPGNTEGLGVRAAVTTADGVDLAELHGLRSVGQSASELHFGLGNATYVDRIEVTWPDGATQIIEDAPVRRTLYVRHPDAHETPLPAGARLSD